MAKIVLHGDYEDKHGVVWHVTRMRPSRGRAFVRRADELDVSAVSMSIGFLEGALTRIKRPRGKK